MLSQLNRLQHCVRIVQTMHEHGLQLPATVLAELDRVCADVETTWNDEPFCWLHGTWKQNPKREW